MKNKSKPSNKPLFPVNNENEIRGRRIATMLALLCSGGILLASFYPFSPMLNNPVYLAWQWQRFLHPFSAAYHPGAGAFRVGHALINIAFYIPLGITTSLALQHHPSDRKSAHWRYLAPLLGFAMSLTIEFLQIGFNDREPDLTDSAMNTLGYLAGYGVILGLIRGAHFSPAILSTLFSTRDRKAVARLLCMAYVVTLIMIIVLPLKPLTEILQYLDHIGGIKIIRGNAGLLDSRMQSRACRTVMVLALFVPFGFLYRAFHCYWNIWRLAICLLVTMGIALALGSGRTFEIAQVLTAGVGALAGVELASWRECR